MVIVLVIIEEVEERKGRGKRRKKKERDKGERERRGKLKVRRAYQKKESGWYRKPTGERKGQTLVLSIRIFYIILIK